MKPRVYVTGPVMEDGLSLLKQYFEVIVHREYPPSKDEILSEARDCFAILAFGAVEPIDSEVINSIQGLRIISRHGVGYDNVDVSAATERGVFVTITRTAGLDLTVSELVFALILAVAKKICAHDCSLRKGLWKPMLGIDLANKTIGIIGLGMIGSKVAEKARAFKMNVIYYDIVRKREAEEKLGVKYVSFEELLKSSDIVSINVPLTKQTYHLIGERELSLMKKNAIIINTARGAVIDQKALVKALSEKWIAGAGLDVFEEEPLRPDDPLLKLENTVLVPHIGSATTECRKRMAVTCANEIIKCFLEGKPSYENTVNKELFKTNV